MSMQRLVLVAALALAVLPNVIQGESPPTPTTTVGDECEVAYQQWMTTLARRFDEFSKASRVLDGRRSHDVDAQSESGEGPAHDFNDVLDLRFEESDVLEAGGATAGDVSATDDDAFFHEHVSGGRIVKEDLMVLHLRAYKRRDMRHKHAVFHERLEHHRVGAQNATKHRRVPRFVGSVAAWWVRWMWSHVMFIVDVLAFVVLVIVPWRMILDMRDPKYGASRRR